MTDDGEIIDADRSNKLFEIQSELVQETVIPAEESISKLRLELEKQENEIIGYNAGRNSKFFDEELDKLECWADDLKSSIEMELKDLDKEIKARKTESKRIINLEDKVREQRDIKELEKKRNSLRLNLFQAQDDIDDKKETLISNIESRMKQSISSHDLFKFRWTIM